MKNKRKLMQGVLEAAIDRALTPLGYIRQGLKFSRKLAAADLVESFLFVERSYLQDSIAHDVFKLYTGIFFPDWLPIRRTTPSEIKNTHWDGPVDQVVKDIKTEWDARSGTDLSRVESELKDVCARVDACYVQRANNFRLYVAAEQGESAKEETIRLINAGVNVNDGGGLLLSPLDVAAYARCLPTVKALVAAGADPNPRPGNKYSPADWSEYDADRIGPSEVTTYLRSLMNRKN